MRWLLIALLFIIAFAAGAHAQDPGLGTQIRTGATNPPTCDPTKGQLFFNNSTTPGVMYYCSATNVWSVSGSSSPSSLLNVIYATDPAYGVLANTKYVRDATFTNGQNTFSSPSLALTAADNGKICFGTNLTLDTSILTTPVTFAQGTLTFVSATSGTCSGGNWTGSTTATNVFVYGSDDSAGLTAAWNAAVAACKVLQLPSGAMLVQSGQFNANSTGDKCIVSTGYNSLAVNGYGTASSLIIPTPNFSSATCTGGNSGVACFFGSTAINVTNLGVWGAGQSAIGAGFNGKVGAMQAGVDAIVGTGVNSYWYNVLLASWGATTTGFAGYQITGESDALAVGVHVDGLGLTNCDFVSSTGGLISLFNVFCAVGTGPNAIFEGGGYTTSHSGVYGWSTSLGFSSIDIRGGSKVWFFGDSMIYQTGSGQSILSTSSVGGTVYLDSVQLVNPTTNGYALGLQTTMTAYVKNSLIQNATGTGNALFICATCVYTSQGGNTISSAATTAVTITAGGAFLTDRSDVYAGGGSYTAISPTVASSAGTSSATVDGGSVNERGSFTLQGMLPPQSLQLP